MNLEAKLVIGVVTKDHAAFERWKKRNSLIASCAKVVEINTLGDIQGLELTDIYIDDSNKFTKEEWAYLDSRIRKKKRE